MWYQSWGFWRRALAFVLGVLALVPQFFPLAPQQGAYFQFAAAVITLLLTFIPDAAVAKLTGLRV